MSLNVKNRRAHELAAQLTDLTGESLTSAVIKALEMRLELERHKRGQKAKAQRILEFADRFAPGMHRPLTSLDHATILYGEDGLPK